MSGKSDEFIKLEERIGKLLRWGVLICGIFLSVGIVLESFAGSGQSWFVLRNGGQIAFKVTGPWLIEIWKTRGILSPEIWMILGLFGLILLPITRVAAAAVLFAKQKDLIFTLCSIFVLTVLAAGLFFGAVH